MPKLDLSGVNFEELSKQTGEVLMASFKDLLLGADQDLQTFGITIGTNLVGAAREADETLRASLIAECKAQFVALAEVNRIRLNQASQQLIDVTLGAVANVITKVLIAAAAAI